MKSFIIKYFRRIQNCLVRYKIGTIVTGHKYATLKRLHPLPHPAGKKFEVHFDFHSNVPEEHHNRAVLLQGSRERAVARLASGMP